MLDQAIEYYVAQLASIPPAEVAALVTSRANLDECFPGEINVAFGYYQALDPAERAMIKEKVANLTLRDVLETIATYNEALLATIEHLHDQGLPVIEYLDTQLARAKLLPTVFDAMLAR